MIYFIQDCETENIKIGFTNQSKKRLTQLQVSTSSKLNLLGEMEGDRKYEKGLHEYFSPDLIRGEWYKYSNLLKSFINNNAKLVKTVTKLSNEDLEYFMNYLAYDANNSYEKRESLQFAERELQKGRKREEIVFWHNYGQNLYALEGIENEENSELIKMFIDFFMDYVNIFKEKLNEKKII